jgi:heme-degrading monooxygenase HmoA
MFGKFSMKRRHPPFILKKLESMQKDESLLNSIGGYRSFEYYFNKNDYKFSDKLSYIIVIKGKSADAIYKGLQEKNDKGKWELKKDTLIIK